MDEIMSFAAKYNLKVVEDNAQAIGGSYTNNKGEVKKWGSIGHIGCTSFFPSKNLGCYGDGGAICTQDDELAEAIRMIANHGQKKKYVHTVLGVNSRLDTLQAAVLDVKLGHLDDFAARRRVVANKYNEAFADIPEIQTPIVADFSNHVYHQYTLRIKGGRRDELKEFLASRGVPSMIYYPIPLYKQEAYEVYHRLGNLEVTETLCQEVLSLPVHTEMQDAVQQIIINEVKEFFK
jgi:dTDP-4-amino-4,6-dideoxygalactose transaminase